MAQRFCKRRAICQPGFTGLQFVAYLGYKIANTWRAGINAGFFTSNILLQGKSSPNLFNSASVSKDVFNKKGSFFFNINNPESKYHTYKSSTAAPNFYQTNESQTPYRSFNFGFNFRFGKLKADIKKNQRGINNDDTKG